MKKYYDKPTFQFRQTETCKKCWDWGFVTEDFLAYIQFNPCPDCFRGKMWLELRQIENEKIIHL